MNKLPNLYTNTFNKKIDNSQEYIKINNNETNIIKPTKYDILNKIDTIFSSKDFVYKTQVKITLDNKENIYTIIGKTKNKLITMDNELINIDDILDIKKID